MLLSYILGDVPATIKYVNEPLVFGGTAECNPIEMNLDPYESKTIKLAYTSAREGNFIEDIKFYNKVAKTYLTLTLRLV